MVGVPGKSLGCKTCRQRKIACTLEKPQCFRCLKTNRVCGGYRRDAIFVIDQATGENVLDLPERSHVKTYRRPVVSTRKPLQQPRKISTSVTSNGNPNPSTYISSPNIEITSPAAFRQQFFCQFLATFVPETDEAVARLKVRTQETTWLILVPEIPELTKALDTAILALSTARLGRSKQDETLIIESRRQYAEGLKELQRALWNPDLMYKDETLAACMALGMYETLECPTTSRRGWVSHSGGCSELIRLRGPKAHADSLGHYLFSSYRLTGIVECIHHRRACYLASPEWKPMAWKDPIIGSFDHLLDNLSLLPGILEDSDRIPNPKAEDMETLFDILERCWNMDANLQTFYKAFESRTEGPLHWPVLSTMNFLPEDTENLFPVAFHFRNLGDAFKTNLFWLNQLILWRTIMEIYGRILKSEHRVPIKKEGSTTPPLPYVARLRPLEHRKDLLTLAKNICQTVEFCIQDDKGLQGPGTLLVTLLLATLTFRFSPGCQHELRWARAALAEVSNRGWRISTHLEP